jgi:hypothetical protein
MAVTAALTERSLWKPREFRIINEQPVAFSDLVVHSFSVAELEDPVIHAASHVLDWEYSEAGAWVMAHAVETPWWSRHVDVSSYSYRFSIIARLSEPDQTFFKLKYT